MRVSKQKAAENRERILTEAARLFRELGLSGVGVDALAEASGLTHGGLYSQFGSKENLAAEAISHAVSGSADKLARIDNLTDYAGHYLSADHRDRRGDGCVMAALVGEMPRQSTAVRRNFTDGIKAMVARVTALSPLRERAEDRALADVATLVGALVLARGVDDPDLSDRILTASRERLSPG